MRQGPQKYRSAQEELVHGETRRGQGDVKKTHSHRCSSSQTPGTAQPGLTPHHCANQECWVKEVEGRGHRARQQGWELWVFYYLSSWSEDVSEYSLVGA